MHYKERTLHRLQEQFLVVGAHDLDELSQNMPRCDRNVEISMDALRCLQYLPNVENLILTSGYVSDPDDFQFLTGLKIRSLKIDYYAYDIDCMTIDLSIFPALEIVFSRTQYGFQNVAGCIQLQTLIVQEWLTDDLQSLSSSSIKALETEKLVRGGEYAAPGVVIRMQSATVGFLLTVGLTPFGKFENRILQQSGLYTASHYAGTENAVS